MKKNSRAIILAAMLTAASLFLSGCGRDDNNPPTVPGNVPKDSAITSGVESSNQEGGHYLWGYYLIKINPIDFTSEIFPVRQITMHVNILKFLEQDPCTNCFKISGITPGPGGTLNIDISIKHPFATPLLTGFDVRGIAIFNGSRIFPASGLRMSDSSLGDGELLNAEGYTTLYNPSTIDHGPLEGYLKGKYATLTTPNATLNGFKRFVSDDPANTRNAFYAGDEITATFQVKMPKPFIFGYAIDASWAPPNNKPVTDPMTDFGPEANCPEPWKIEVGNLGPGLTDNGGTTILQINVYDRGGKESHSAPVVECPELFDGSIACEFENENPDYSVWRATISNDKLAAIGNYRCLVSVEDNENDPVGKPWTDLTAYLPVNVPVLTDGNLLWAKKAGSPQEDYGYGITALSDDSTVVVGWYMGKATFGQGEPNKILLMPFGFGVSNIFIARYNPDGTLAWVTRAGTKDNCSGWKVTALSDDSTVVTGFFSSSATFGYGEPNQTILVSEGLHDIFIARYNPDGTLAWAKSAGGPGHDYGEDITALSDDSIVLTGEFKDHAVFGKGEPNQTELSSFGIWDIYIARYNPDGTLAWAKRAGGQYYDYGCGVTALSDDSTVITGCFKGTAYFGVGEPSQISLNSYGSTDIFIACYNPDGMLVWAKNAGGPDDDGGYAVVALSDNSVAVTGDFETLAIFGKGEPHQTAITSKGSYDMYVARYNPDGTLAWVKFGGGWGVETGCAVSALSDNSIVVGGYYFGPAKFGEGEPNQTVLTSEGDPDIFAARYDPDGMLDWVKGAGGQYEDICCGVAGLSDNSIVATGIFSDEAIFGKDEPAQTILTSVGDTDIFIARFMP
ncbi:MAG: hypothetical protein ABIC40_04685 [bacterium]